MGRRSGICSIACSSGIWATTTGTRGRCGRRTIQLYPPEKGQPRTFIEAQYPAKLTPLNLARAAQSDPGVIRIRSSSQEISEAVTAILNGESNKAATRPAEDFLRLAIPVVAGAQAKLAVAAIDQQYRFQWLLAPENAPPAPAETNAQPGTCGSRNKPSGPRCAAGHRSLNRATRCEAPQWPTPYVAAETATHRAPRLKHALQDLLPANCCFTRSLFSATDLASSCL